MGVSAWPSARKFNVGRISIKFGIRDLHYKLLGNLILIQIGQMQFLLYKTLKSTSIEFIKNGP
jgi:hypothetical protein